MASHRERTTELEIVGLAFTIDSKYQNNEQKSQKVAHQLEETGDIREKAVKHWARGVSQSFNRTHW
jgi:RNase H-fold protein (predicted Holliday junction resolvase)